VGALDFLIPEGPKARIYLNMNTAYIDLSKNFHCSANSFTSIRLAFSAAINGEMNSSLDHQSYDIPNWKLHESFSSNEVPNYNIEVEIKNLDYIFDFIYVYEFYDGSGGPSEFYSAKTRIEINNNPVTLNTKTTNNYIKNNLNNIITKRDNFKIFFDPIEEVNSTNSETGDIVTHSGGLQITQIREYRDDGTPVLAFANEEFIYFTKYLTSHEMIPNILNNLYPVSTPSDKTIEFNCERNNEILKVTLLGNLEKLREE
jgi:hypothetical protein